MPDFLGSLLVFSVVLSIFLFSWSSVQSNQQNFNAEKEMRQDAIYSSTFLVSTPGYPENWTSENVQIPGFATQDNVLSIRKIKEFQKLSYNKQKVLLQATEFSLNISLSESDRVISYGKYSKNASTVVPVSRSVALNEPDTEGQVMWAYETEPEKDNTIYGMNFTVQSGSNLIGDSLSSIDIEIDSSSDIVSNTSKEDIVQAGVDKDNDGVIETNLTQDISEWETEVESQNQIQIGFSGDAYTNPEAGDSILVDLGDLTNPPEGEYEVRIRANEDTDWQDGNLGVGEEYELQKEKNEAELELVVWNE